MPNLLHWKECTGATIRALERTSIRDFMVTHQQYLRGRVLDYGAGKQPYKDLVKGEYVAYDRTYDLYVCQNATPGFDTVMCNQVIQYQPEPAIIIGSIFESLKPGGHLLLTYPTSWDEVVGDDDDYFRFTKKGMEYLLTGCFHILHHTLRASISFPGFSFPLGYGVVAQRL